MTGLPTRATDLDSLQVGGREAAPLLHGVSILPGLGRAASLLELRQSEVRQGQLECRAVGEERHGDS